MRNFDAPAEISRWQTFALGAGAIGVILWLVGLSMNAEQAYRSWLLGFIFWGGIGIGSLGILMLQYLTGGAWGVVVRRFVEAGSRTIPLLAILFMPIMWGMMTNHLYTWTNMPNDPLVMHRAAWMNVPGFGIRAIIYFGLLSIMGYLLNKWSGQQDRTDNYEDSATFLGRATAFCGPAMPFYALVVTFMAVDWTMMLDPHWYSTMWGFLYIAGWALSCFAFLIALLAALSDKAPMNGIVGKKHFHDIGKLMLALVMVWAYFNLSQWLIIWSGNLPEETPWYLKRIAGGWGVVGVLLIVFHFAVPFIILLSQNIKKNAKWLSLVAILILFMRLVDYYFQIGPSPMISGGSEGHFSWMDIAGPVGIGGIWLWWFFKELKQRPLVPINDPFLENAIAHGKAH
jgi:NADH:ubiquinone oxidoreductase subunit 3 (subunit A)